MSNFETFTTPITMETAGQVVLFNTENHRYYSLDPVAAYVYQLIQTPLTLTEICAAIHRVFDVESDYCEKDIHHLLIQMEAEGLIEARPERNQLAS